MPYGNFLLFRKVCQRTWGVRRNPDEVGWVHAYVRFRYGRRVLHVVVVVVQFQVGVARKAELRTRKKFFQISLVFTLLQIPGPRAAKAGRRRVVPLKAEGIDSTPLSAGLRDVSSVSHSRW